MGEEERRHELWLEAKLEMNDVIVMGFEGARRWPRASS
jgi:hypothetical protein